MSTEPDHAWTPKALRILHLEDNEQDCDLVRAVLSKEEKALDLVQAASGPQFEAALRGDPFDLILADFTVPGYHGTDALALAQKQWPHVPFLFVSGTIGEERAIAAIRSGATDYVLKSRLDRLGPAVHRALREADERRQREEAEAARRRAEASFRGLFERFRAMAERIDQVFWIATPDMGQWLYVSPAYESIWGRPVVGLPDDPQQWLESVLTEDRARFVDARAQVAAGRETRVEYRIRRPDGAVRWVDERSYPARMVGAEADYAVGVAMDITHRKELESQLHQAQKMEAVGQLAGGVAHDFNNVLTVVTGYSRLLLDTRNLPRELVEPLEQIFTAGTRATNLTRQLLVFSRKQSAQRRIVDLNEVVADIAKMLGRLIGEHIVLDVEPAPAPATAEADSGMIEQVIMNLAVNARDAMPGGGKLTLATGHVRIDDPASRRHPAARAGEFVCLSVRDTGCGIAPEHLPRIFEPFFTTKGAAQGTGLGLATVFGIVQQHHGWIEVESAVNAGTCFRVLLPARAAPPEAAPRRAGKASPAAGGSETVLLVEDETAVREFAVAVLKSHGYRVLQAASGLEALEVWKWHSPRIAVLFSDLVMPEGVGGLELAATLRRDKPTLRVILTSGYAEESVGAEFRPPPGTHFISKPYKPQTLAQTMREALDGSFHR